MPRRIILDTDIGDDIDDAFALALAISSPELELVGVTTVHGPVEKRARIARKMLNLAGRTDVPVIPGFQGCGSPEHEPNQAAWATGTGLQPPAQAAVEYIIREVDAAPGEVTIIGVGPLSNIAKCLEQDPGIAQRIAELVIMAGSVRKGYAGADRPVAEYNVACDPQAAMRVFESGAKLTVVPLDATGTLALPERHLAAIRASNGPLASALKELVALWQAAEQRSPVLHDPLAVSLAFDRALGRFEDMHLQVTGEGMTVATGARPANSSVCVQAEAERLFLLVAGRIAAYQVRQPAV